MQSLGFNLNYRSPCFFKRKGAFQFRYRAYFEGNLLRFVRARAHVRTLITRISYVVGMRNAKLRNHLKRPKISLKFMFTPAFI